MMVDTQAATAVTTTEPEPTPPERTLHDRCDRCGFRAYYIAQRIVDGVVKTLQFCKHHGEVHDVVLTLNNWTLWDFTEELYRKPEYKDDDE